MLTRVVLQALQGDVPAYFQNRTFGQVLEEQKVERLSVDSEIELWQGPVGTSGLKRFIVRDCVPWTEGRIDPQSTVFLLAPAPHSPPARSNHPLPESASTDALDAEFDQEALWNSPSLAALCHSQIASAHSRNGKGELSSLNSLSGLPLVVMEQVVLRGGVTVSTEPDTSPSPLYSSIVDTLRTEWSEAQTVWTVYGSLGVFLRLGWRDQATVHLHRPGTGFGGNETIAIRTALLRDPADPQQPLVQHNGNMEPHVFASSETVHWLGSFTSQDTQPQGHLVERSTKAGTYRFAAGVYWTLPSTASGTNPASGSASNADSEIAAAKKVILQSISGHQLDRVGSDDSVALPQYLRARSRGQPVSIGQGMTLAVPVFGVSQQYHPDPAVVSDKSVALIDHDLERLKEGILNPEGSAFGLVGGGLHSSHIRFYRVKSVEGQPTDSKSNGRLQQHTADLQASTRYRVDPDATEVVLEERPLTSWLPPLYSFATSLKTMLLQRPRVLNSGRLPTSAFGVLHRILPHLQTALDWETYIAQCLQAQGTRNVITCLHGLPDNFPAERFQVGLEMYGVPYLVLDVSRISGGTNADDVLINAAKAVEGGGPGTTVVIRHAQELSSEGKFAHWLARNAGEHCNRRSEAGFHAVLVFETNEPVPPSFSSLSLAAVKEVRPPKEEDRRIVASQTLALVEAHHLKLSMTLNLDSFVSWTVGFSVADIIVWLQWCAVRAVSVGYRTVSGTAGAAPLTKGSPVLDEVLCESTLKDFQQQMGHNVTSTKLQQVRWSDVGGLEDAKREIRETIELPLLHPEYYEGMKQRAGVLFYGPPGCGKTLLAKAVATELKLNFLSVKGPELINMYVGESEKNIRLLFQRARDCAPCIVFFDEIDALAPARGSKGDAGGVMDRIVAQLLAEVDGAARTTSSGEKAGRVFIIAATNRPDLLDPSLMRPGRFDRLCYLGIPSTHAEQLQAIKALTRKFNMEKDVDLDALVGTLEPIYTGADLFALCSDAMMLAVDELVQNLSTAVVEGKLSAAEMDEGNQKVTVGVRHFQQALQKLKPSVSKEDLKRYESLRTQFAANAKN